jgi:cation diffusion facilitator CzcD-associated flavoprotein CzcO
MSESNGDVHVHRADGAALAPNGEQINGNGHIDLEDPKNQQTKGYQPHIPPAEAHKNSEYIKRITIPLNTKPAWTPTKKLRMVIIGAGYSGMIMAHKLQHTHAAEMSTLLDFVVYEARSTVGGTWDANTYPGVRCDVPSAIYAFPFEPNPNWSTFFTTGQEIQEYFVKTVKKWKLDENVMFKHRVTEARWMEEQAQWRLKVQHGGHEFEDHADILISARGFLSTWRWPSIPGMHDFKGHKVHSAAWDHEYSYSHKRIAVIGNGSSGIQILPEMAKLDGTEVVSFQRGPTWVVSRHSPAKLMGSNDPSPNPVYSEEDKQRLCNPEELKAYRKRVQGGVNAAFKLFVKGSEYNKDTTEFAKEQMASKLNYDPELCEKLIPKYELGCRRITPGTGYLESFTRPNVRLTNSDIARITEEGMLTADGKFYPLDVIVCATGFDISQVPSFRIIGRNEVSLAEKWKDEPGTSPGPKEWLTFLRSRQCGC